MCVDSIPEKVRMRFDGSFVDGVGVNNVYVSIGVFSVIRMERRVQLVLPACRFCLPENDSKPCNNDDPCSIFGKMQFPIAEFYPYADDNGNCDRCAPQNNRCDKNCK
jgi:hypothetical protein